MVEPHAVATEPTPQSEARAARVVALAVAVVLAVVYGLTLCRTVYWYDSAEFAAKAASLGVPHPPGYPLYTLVAHVFTWLPGEPALGVNIMSAVFGIGSALLLFALARTLGMSLATSAVSALFLGLTKTFWSNAVVAEVYTPGLVCSLGVLLLIQRAGATGRPRLLFAAGLLGGLGVGMHMSIATLGLGYVWLLVTHGIPPRAEDQGWRQSLADLRSGWFIRVRRTAIAGVCAAAGLLVFAYVPLVKFERWDAVEWVTFRKNSVGGAFRRKFLSDYDFGGRVDLVLGIFETNLLAIGIGLAVLGLALAIWRRPRLGIGYALALLGNVYWFFNYNVPDLDVFFLPALALSCLFAGYTADYLLASFAKQWPPIAHAPWALLALPLFLGSRHYNDVDLSDETAAATYAESMCRALPKKARVLLYSTPAEWRYYAVFMYVQEAMGQCRDVEIWRRPRLSKVMAAVKRGEDVFAFHPVGGMDNNFNTSQILPEGLLHVDSRKQKVRSNLGRRHSTGKGRD